MPFDPDTYDWPLPRRAYARTVARARRNRAWFRPTFEGFENLRGDRGLMLVANHGLLGFEWMPLVLGAWDHAGRPVRAGADHVLFASAPQRRFMEARGGVQATPAVAHRLLSRGEILYVCPGGAREALAGPRDRYKLFWEGHFGFVRSAIRAGAAIVPMAIVGHDEIFRQVLTADEMRRTRLGRFVVDAIGAKYVPPLYAGVGPIPLPQRFCFVVGAPIEVPADPALADDPRVVEGLHAEAAAAVRALLARTLVARAQRIDAMPAGLEKWLEQALLEAAG